MGFVKVELPPKTACGHRTPSSNDGKLFGIGTIWRCDTCGSAFRFTGTEYDQRERDSWDKWERAQEHDGPDNRSIPEAPKVETQFLGIYASGTK